MSLKKSTLFFTLGTLISRVSGLVRDAVLSASFGAGVLMDAFNIAFRIPNLFRDMLAEGAIGSAFTKLYSELGETNAGAARSLFIDALSFMFSFVSLLVCIGIFFSPQIVDLMTVAADSDYKEVNSQAVSLTRLLFPFLLIACLNAIGAGALHQKGSFFRSALSPIIGNLGYIGGALVLGPFLQKQRFSFLEDFGDPAIVGLAVGVLFGAVLQLLIILYFARSALIVLPSYKKLTNCSRIHNIKRLITLSLPMIMASSVGPVSGLINTNFASAVGPGAVSWLVYAFRLFQLPVGLFGVAVGIVALPALTRSITQSKGVVTQKAIDQLLGALGLVAFCMSASFAFLFYQSEGLVTLIFERGAFTASDSSATAKALSAYAVGLFGYGFIKVLTAFYYAIERTSFPMKVSFFGIVSTTCGCLLLVDTFGHVGLASASAITLCLNSSILFFGLKSYFSLINWPKFFVVAGGLVGTAAIALLAQYVLLEQLLASILGQQGYVSTLAKLLLSSAIVVSCFLVFLMFHYRQFSPKKIVTLLKSHLKR